MSNLVDLDERLRSAAFEPETERALDEVFRRVRRRGRRKLLAVTTAVAIVGGLVTVWGVERQRTHDASVIVRAPSTSTTPTSSAGDVLLHQLWSAHDVGGSDALSSHPVVVSTGDALYTEGQSGAVEPRGQISALDRDTGEVRWTARLGGPALLQGVAAGTVIANPQSARIVGLDAADGTVRWSISLSDLGLDGYGADASAVTAPISAIGLSATNEGDVRPPVILGINTATGAVEWRTPLVEGTDLNWGTPPVSNGETVFLSTLSHPGSARENVAHLIDLADGSVRWTAGMGGTQGFHDVPAAFDGAYVHLPANPDVLTVDRGDGNRRWQRPGWGSTLVDGGLWIWRGTDALALVDPKTGGVVRRVDSPIDEPSQLLDLDDGLVGVVGRTEFAVIDTNGAIRLRHTWTAPLVDVARFDRGVLSVATEDRAVTAYTIDTTSLLSACEEGARAYSGVAIAAFKDPSSEGDVICWADGEVPKSPPPGAVRTDPFDRLVFIARADGTFVRLVQAGYRDQMKVTPPGG
jgi:outer membrane protein assembly factor BamB